MSKYRRLSADEKWLIIEPIIKELDSVKSVSNKNRISEFNIRTWIRKYIADGLAGLESGKGWKQYTEELKRQAVNDVLVKGVSQQEVVKKYNISNHSVLKGWINCYNSGKPLEATSTGRVGTIMTEGRKTTWEERIEIAEYAIARNKDYQSAMEKYRVSYQQLYSWVKKYEAKGQEGLRDGRGKKPEKDENQLTETEKLKLKIKQLEARNEFLEMQDAFGKKLMELEARRGRSR